MTLENALVATKEKDPKKKVNASNSRALNGMKQKVKRAAKEQEALLKTYNEVARLTVTWTLSNVYHGLGS